MVTAAVPQLLLRRAAGYMLLVHHRLVVGALLGLLLGVDLVGDGVRSALDLLNPKIIWKTNVSQGEI